MVDTQLEQWGGAGHLPLHNIEGLDIVRDANDVGDLPSTTIVSHHFLLLTHGVPAYADHSTQHGALNNRMYHHTRPRTPLSEEEAEMSRIGGVVGAETGRDSEGSWRSNCSTADTPAIPPPTTTKGKKGGSIAVITANEW